MKKERTTMSLKTILLVILLWTVGGALLWRGLFVPLLRWGDNEDD